MGMNLLTTTAVELRNDIAEFQEVLTRIPTDSRNPDDQIVRNIYTELLKVRQEMLARLEHWEVQ